MNRRRILSADEQDVYTSWRHFFIWTGRSGAVKKIKRRTHRRERREGKQEIKAQIDDTVN